RISRTLRQVTQHGAETLPRVIVHMAGLNTARIHFTDGTSTLVVAADRDAILVIVRVVAGITAQVRVGSSIVIGIAGVLHRPDRSPVPVIASQYDITLTIRRADGTPTFVVNCR